MYSANVVASNGGWIELWLVSNPNGVLPVTSRLVAQFDLAQNTLWSFDFCRSESPIWEMQPGCHEGGFPFTSNSMNAIQVLEINFASGLAFLIISNEVFVVTLKSYLQNPGISVPRRFRWNDWAQWTSLWNEDLGMIYESVYFT